MKSRDAGRSIPVNVVFIHQLSDDEVRQIESLGVVFPRVDGQVLHTGPIYSATARVDAIFALARSDLVVRMEQPSHPHTHGNHLPRVLI